jgi:hypothetical protein
LAIWLAPGNWPRPVPVDPPAPQPQTAGTAYRLNSLRVRFLLKPLACRCVSVRSITVEKHELSKFEFQIIEKALKALLQSNLDPVTADKVTDLRNMFQDAYTGWLEVYKEAA